jgi:hypothetical protein
MYQISILIFDLLFFFHISIRLGGITSFFKVLLNISQLLMNRFIKGLDRYPVYIKPIFGTFRSVNS